MRRLVDYNTSTLLNTLIAGGCVNAEEVRAWVVANWNTTYASEVWGVRRPGLRRPEPIRGRMLPWWLLVLLIVLALCCCCCMTRCIVRGAAASGGGHVAASSFAILKRCARPRSWRWPRTARRSRQPVRQMTCCAGGARSTARLGDDRRRRGRRAALLLQHHHGRVEVGKPAAPPERHPSCGCSSAELGLDRDVVSSTASITERSSAVGRRARGRAYV